MNLLLGFKGLNNLLNSTSPVVKIEDIGRELINNKRKYNDVDKCSCLTHEGYRK